jgi:hypothetical protein
MAYTRQSDDESLLKAVIEELTEWIGVLSSAWRMVRHPLSFDDFLELPARRAAKFILLTSAILAFGATKLVDDPRFSRMMATVAGEDAAAATPGVHLGIFGLRIIYPYVHVDITARTVDFIPLIYVVASFVLALFVHCTFLIGKRILPSGWKIQLNRVIPSGDRSFDTVAKACFYAIGLLLLYLGAFYVIFLTIPIENVNAKYQDNLSIYIFYSAFGVCSILMIYVEFIVFIRFLAWLSRIYSIKLWATYLVTIIVLAAMSLVSMFIQFIYRIPILSG